jgi:hypothetical protein
VGKDSMGLVRELQIALRPCAKARPRRGYRSLAVLEAYAAE